jgi:hypothetical protein
MGKALTEIVEQESTGRASDARTPSPPAAVSDKEPQIKGVLGCWDKTIALVHAVYLIAEPSCQQAAGRRDRSLIDGERNVRYGV